MQQHIFQAALAVVASTFYSGTLDASEELDTIVVSATRFADSQPHVAGNISVITREEIRSIPAQNLPDLLRARAGIDVRPLYGALGTDASVDMRGFGSTATSNTLILIDGRRVNPMDMGSIIWSAIPKECIERIEILRGSGTVLYGDGATGGVINIITDKSGRAAASVTATAGSYGFTGLDAELANGGEKGYFNAFAHHADADGYRQNSRQSEQTLSGRAGFYLPSGEIFADYAVYQESAGLPGNRLSAAYRDNPSGTTTPNDSQRRDGYRFAPGLSYHINNQLSFEAEVATEQQNLHSRYVAANYFSDRVRDTLSLTPRLRWIHELGSLPSETVIGVDYYDGTVTSTNRGGPNQGATQTSLAYYLQNITHLTEPLSLTLGGREQRMQQSARQDAYAAWFSSAMNGESTRTRSAYDVSLAYAADTWRVYGKSGTTFRFANTDELFGSDPFGNPLFAGDLKPQHGTINEVGGKFGVGPLVMRAARYRLDLTDEIGYDGALFANVNLAPTRRDGGEAEVDWKIADSLSAKLAYAYIDARFRAGSYAGKALPLVAREQASLQMSWDAGRPGQYSALIHHVGERPYGSDFANAKEMLAGYTTVDLQGGWDVKPWRITAKLLNVFDRKYSPFAGYSALRNDYYYYPADGRALYVAGRYNF